MTNKDESRYRIGIANCVDGGTIIEEALKLRAKNSPQINKLRPDYVAVRGDGFDIGYLRDLLPNLRLPKVLFTVGSFDELDRMASEAGLEIDLHNDPMVASDTVVYVFKNKN